MADIRASLRILVGAEEVQPFAIEPLPLGTGAVEPSTAVQAFVSAGGWGFIEGKAQHFLEGLESGQAPANAQVQALLKGVRSTRSQARTFLGALPLTAVNCFNLRPPSFEAPGNNSSPEGQQNLLRLIDGWPGKDLPDLLNTFLINASDSSSPPEELKEAASQLGLLLLTQESNLRLAAQVCDSDDFLATWIPSSQRDQVRLLRTEAKNLLSTLDDPKGSFSALKVLVQVAERSPGEVKRELTAATAPSSPDMPLPSLVLASHGGWEVLKKVSPNTIDKLLSGFDVRARLIKPLFLLNSGADLAAT
ncbi:MAG: hypothetical protein EOP82_27585 [Variovorax sp.]|nr:MAG: hypothetical protein EOP82_27585 [Variovorax sp.]